MINKLCMDKISELQIAFNKIFQSKNPFENVFTEEVEQKILLFPTDGYYLNDEQYNALMCAINSIKEQEFFISEIEGDCFTKNSNDGVYKHGHWMLNIKTSYEEYRNLTLPLENALYSLKGTWGVIISHEEHAILGGDSTFISTFKINCPNWNASQQEFEEQWQINQRQYNSNIDWIPGFLKQFE